MWIGKWKENPSCESSSSGGLKMYVAFPNDYLSCLSVVFACISDAGVVSYRSVCVYVLRPIICSLIEIYRGELDWS